MQMNNMAELITVAKYWRQWQDHRWIVCVFNNEDLNQVTWEQRIINGDPKFEASQQIPNVSYWRFAELIGLRGIYIDRPELVGSAWDQALASDVPVVLEFKTDPEVFPLPPHITFQQARICRSHSPKAIPTRLASSAAWRGRFWRPSCPEKNDFCAAQINGLPPVTATVVPDV
jgi:thiamine pyrophosphate-dependent acetolactate synthase large subunit-like protein